MKRPTVTHSSVNRGQGSVAACAYRPAVVTAVLVRCLASVGINVLFQFHWMSVKLTQNEN